MTSIFNVSNSIGKETVQQMKEIGIDTVEKLASSSIENLLVINGISISQAKRYINFAQQHLHRINAKTKIFNIINKGVDSRASKSTNAQIPSKSKNAQIPSKPSDERIKPNVSISSIKALASSSIEDLSKRKGMDNAKAKRYIEIAKKYLESMRNEQVITKTSISEDKPLGFVKFDTSRSLKKPEIRIPPKQKQEIQEQLKLIKKPALEIKPIQNVLSKKEIKSKTKKEEIKKSPELKTFFSPTTVQRIRFLHYKIKKLEKALEKHEDSSFSELNNVVDYIKILNVNYKTQSQIKIFKELEITPSFYDPIAKKEIQIWDLIFECSRVLWISAQAYSYLSNKFETEGSIEKAIVAMVESSKMFKTAAYFSAACTRQEDKGIALSVDNLELNSEECRILAQNLATISEETKGNLSMASNLSAGLSALTKRLAFLRDHDKKKEYQFKAQYNYDIGRACSLKAKYLQKLSPEGESEKIEQLQKKANYYYMKAEEAWEFMLNNFDNLTDSERESLRTNLSIVNNDIIENDVETIYDAEALEIQDPEPLIIIPENLAPFVPRTTNFLTKYQQSDLNFDAYKRYRNLMSDVTITSNKLEELKNNKAGIGRTLKQLKILYDNNDIDINSFTELFEKYSIKLESIESAIQNLKGPKPKKPVPKKQKQILKSTM
ncbi:MAG: helix-hairpin-helix domain-containing protein [Promethearchaeota archaeon]